MSWNIREIILPWQLYSRERNPPSPWTGGWVCPRVGCGSFGGEKDLFSLQGFQTPYP